MEATADRILRDPEVRRLTALSRVQRWRKVRDGSFPAPVQLGTNSIGWRLSDITAWLASRAPVSYAPRPAQEASHAVAA